MRKTTIDLTEEQYFFQTEKALELQKRNQNASIVSIIGDGATRPAGRKQA